MMETILLKQKYRPLIGVTAQIDGEGKRWIRSSYADAVCAAGGMPVFLDYLTDENMLVSLCAHLDGVLFTGGVDIHPKYFGEEIGEGCGEITETRDIFEFALYRHARASGMPILGICRGMQLLNVAEGGTLWQDIGGHKDGVLHTVRTEADSLLRCVFGAEAEVNSFHHQTVKALGNGCRVTAMAEDGTVEGIERVDTAFWLGVQWHPELLAEENGVLAAFVSACTLYAVSRR